MILVVSSVEVDVIRINKLEWKQDEEDLNGVFASVYKVSVENIGLLHRWHAILWCKEQQSKAGLKVHTIL